MGINRKITKDVFISNEEIIEWDIRAANTSVMREYNLASDEVITRFENMSREDRHIQIGLYSRDNKAFASALSKSFTDIVHRFIDKNRLDADRDIICIKNDAVFIRNYNIQEPIIGKCTFVPKNIYTGALFIPNYEFYYNSAKVDVKGISDNVLNLHIDGVLAFIRGLFKTSGNYTRMIKFLKEYSVIYKDKELPFNAYREFNTRSQFLVRFSESDSIYMSDIDDELVGACDIRHNFEKIILEAIQILV